MNERRAQRKREAKREREPGDAELEVLTTLWDDGPATVREVMQRLHDRGRRVAYTTVLTYLTRLEQKGLVASDKAGLAYVYKPRITRGRVAKSRVRSVVDQLFDGSAGTLVLHLVENEKLSSEEVAALRRLIDGLDGQEKG